jgi:hypothetical protein
MGEIGFVVSPHVELIPSLLNDLSCPSVVSTLVSCVADTIIFQPLVSIVHIQLLN